MSQLQSIASRLRALAQDATPLSASVEASARQLKALGQQVEALSRSGVNVDPLVAALRAAEAQASAAAHAASEVKAEGVAWADDLARGDQTTAPKGSADGRLRGVLGGLLGLGAAGRGSRLTSHPEMHQEVLDRLDAAQAAVDRWGEEDRRRANHWFGDDSDAVRRELAGRVERIRGVLDDVQLVPFEPGEGDEHTFAYVYPDASDRKIYVGDLFWNSGTEPPDSQAGVLFHELSHFNDIAGTGDVAYGRDPCRDLTEQGASTALWNADNYEYYIEEL